MVYSEEFARRNGSLAFTSTEFAEVMRDLMRALASPNNYPAIHRAGRRMNDVMRLIAASEDDFSWADIFNEAISRLYVKNSDYHSFDYYLDCAARSGVAMLAETTAGDGFGKARASSRRHDFMSDIGHFVDFRREQAAAIKSQRSEVNRQTPRISKIKKSGT